MRIRLIGLRPGRLSDSGSLRIIAQVLRENARSETVLDEPFRLATVLNTKKS